MAVPFLAALPFPIRQVPTWAVLNVDDQRSLPLMGQFNTDISWVGGKPIWAKRPAIAGGDQWMQYVGTTPLDMQFTFHAISNDVLDQYPVVAWKRLKELAARDASLGRPPLVWFVHGKTLVQGYITSYGDPVVKHWQSDSQAMRRIVREIGPVQVTITIRPGPRHEISLSTSYVLHTGSELVYEELAKTKFGDAAYGASLREYNQGKVEGQQIEIPHKQNPNVKRTVESSAFFNPDDLISGL